MEGAKTTYLQPQSLSRAPFPPRIEAIFYPFAKTNIMNMVLAT
jgi:hypothetical protein